jgi:hypothetical protein
VVEDVAAFGGGVVNWTGSALPRQLRSERVSSAYFRLFGVPFLFGRGLNAQEDARGRFARCRYPREFMAPSVRQRPKGAGANHGDRRRASRHRRRSLVAIRLPRFRSGTRCVDPIPTRPELPRPRALFPGRRAAKERY